MNSLEARKVSSDVRDVVRQMLYILSKVFLQGDPNTGTTLLLDVLGDAVLLDVFNA